MTIKSRSDGDFPPTFLGQKQALCCGRGWQNCRGSDPLRLFLPSPHSNTKVGLTQQLLPSSPPLCDCLVARFSTEVSASPGEPCLMVYYKGLLHCRQAWRATQQHFQTSAFTDECPSVFQTLS